MKPEIYPERQGKHGSIFQIAEGVIVSQSIDGTWDLAVRHKGERQRRRFGKDLDKAVQVAELTATKLGLVLLRRDEEKSYTVEMAAGDWLQLNKTRWTESTIERYSSILRDFVVPSLGRMPLERVTRQQIKQLLVDSLAAKAAKTVELIHAVISGIFSEAIENGRTRENPAQGLLKKVLPAKNKRNESLPNPLSKGDLEKMLQAVRTHLEAHTALAIEVMAYSGMRLGECLAMHRDHLEVSHCQYLVAETVRRGKFGLPKSGKRLIDLPEGTVIKLQKHILQLRKSALAEGSQVGYLFPWLTQRIVQRGLERACRAAKLRVRSPHDLRHTYATILLMDHYSPAYVQKQLGHHSISMTVDIYGHWVPGEGKRDLEKTLGSQKPRSQGSNHEVSQPQQ